MTRLHLQVGPLADRVGLLGDQLLQLGFQFLAFDASEQGAGDEPTLGVSVGAFHIFAMFDGRLDDHPRSGA